VEEVTEEGHVTEARVTMGCVFYPLSAGEDFHPGRSMPFTEFLTGH
jgi:hypothetical protein